MLYATLTAWGMHRMGEGLTKLREWQQFYDSFTNQSAELNGFRDKQMLCMSTIKYEEAVSELRKCYHALNLTEAKATVVVNSKALYHLFPEFIPPIDRQYILRFFRPNLKAPPDLPRDKEEQFKLFCETCVKINKLAGELELDFIRKEAAAEDVSPLKAIDNAIISYVRTRLQKEVYPAKKKKAKIAVRSEVIGNEILWYDKKGKVLCVCHEKS